jgi:hypothetical protein
MLTLTGILFSLFSDLVRAPNLKNRPRTRSRLLRIWLWNQRYIIWLSVSQRPSGGLCKGSEFEEEFEFERTISCRAE